MQNQQHLDELKLKLLEKGLPRTYVRRVIIELSEHGEDLQHDRLLTEFPKEIIGDPDKLADAIFEKMKKSRFVGRHRIFSFIFLPLVTLAGLVALSMIGVGLLSDDLTQSDDFIPYAYGYYYFLKYVLPISLALGFCFIARNSFCGFRWAFVACVSLTVLLLLSQINMTPPIPGSPGTGTFNIGLGFPYDIPLGTLQEKLKCILGYYKGLWQFTPLFLFGIFYFFTSLNQKKDLRIE